MTHRIHIQMAVFGTLVHSIPLLTSEHICNSLESRRLMLAIWHHLCKPSSTTVTAIVHQSWPASISQCRVAFQRAHKRAINGVGPPPLRRLSLSHLVNQTPAFSTNVNWRHNITTSLQGMWSIVAELDALVHATLAHSRH